MLFSDAALALQDEVNCRHVFPLLSRIVHAQNKDAKL